MSLIEQVVALWSDKTLATDTRKILNRLNMPSRSQIEKVSRRALAARSCEEVFASEGGAQSFESWVGNRLYRARLRGEKFEACVSFYDAIQRAFFTTVAGHEPRLFYKVHQMWSAYFPDVVLNDAMKKKAGFLLFQKSVSYFCLYAKYRTFSPTDELFKLEVL